MIDDHFPNKSSVSLLSKKKKNLHSIEPCWGSGFSALSPEEVVYRERW